MEMGDQAHPDPASSIPNRPLQYALVVVAIVASGAVAIGTRAAASAQQLPVVDVCSLMPIPKPPVGEYLLGMPMKDYGSPCESDEECSSGLCARSCSALAWEVGNATSCICPAPASDEAVQVCCGCITNGQTVVHTCPSYPDFARAEDDHEGLAVPVRRPGYNDSGLLRCGWWGAGEWTDNQFEPTPLPEVKTIFQPPGTTNHSKSNPWDRSGKAGVRSFGEECESHEECMSGMCGTGCDCPSFPGAEPCSCECLSHWPKTTCCACFLGSNPQAQACPSFNRSHPAQPAQQHMPPPPPITVTIGINTSSLCERSSELPPPRPPTQQILSKCGTPNCTQHGSSSPLAGYPKPLYAWQATRGQHGWRNRSITCEDGAQHRCGSGWGYDCV